MGRHSQISTAVALLSDQLRLTLYTVVPREKTVHNLSTSALLLRLSSPVLSAPAGRSSHLLNRWYGEDFRPAHAYLCLDNKQLHEPRRGRGAHDPCVRDGDPVDRLE